MGLGGFWRNGLGAIGAVALVVGGCSAEPGAADLEAAGDVLSLFDIQGLGDAKGKADGIQDQATAQQDADPTDVGDTGGGLPDLVAGEDGSSGGDATSGDDAGTDATADKDTVGGAETTPTGCEFAANPAQGEPGAACKSAGDCETGLCVDSAVGKICTKTCQECCPTGFGCSQMPGTDPIFACLPKLLALCRPCTLDSECAALNTGALCVTSAGNGSFCGGLCAQDADCPTDYACQDAKGSQGAGKQCVRITGDCPCSAKSILDGASTACSNQTEEGTCTGIRKCTPAGLTPCSAAIPSAEVCDGADNNCDGATDGPGSGGCTTWYTDGDGDAWGSGSGECTCKAPAGSPAKQAGDCADGDLAVHPGVVETCNGLDDDCNGATDEGCDDDGDGWCDIAMLVVGDPLVCPQGKKDCNDADNSVHPNQKDKCGNGVDDDCDGQTDVGPTVGGCTVFFVDGDGDGYGSGDGQCLCGASGGYTAKTAGDCADGDYDVHPGAVETCNGKDDNCNQVVDEAGASGCTPWYVDADKDTFGAGASACLCAGDATYTVEISGDCNDADKATHPGGTELCNDADDDCDGKTDVNADDCTNFYADKDGDGYGTTLLASKCLCKAIDGYVSTFGDCNDNDTAIHPGAAEVCNGQDDDCDSQKDPVGSGECVLYYLDVDKDGYGQSAASQCQCLPGQGYIALQGDDCNDGDTAASPDGTETCNTKDDDCNGLTDEAGGTNWYADTDKDGFGWAPALAITCAAPDGYVANATDCNDSEALSFPGGSETCDGIDNNCNSQTDEGVKPTWYLDLDLDTFGDVNSQVPACSAPDGYVGNSSDCNDGDGAIFPGNPEVCDGKDNNCSGATDEGVTTTYYKDNDGDTYGDKSVVREACSAPSTFVSDNTDCNDTAGAGATIHPNATELCNGYDDNCDLYIDEGVKTTFYRDLDQDGYGSTANGTTLACTKPVGYEVTSSDCDDDKGTVWPGNPEVCDGLDNNCNNSVDEGVKTTYYLDGDSDTWGLTGNTTVACAKPVGYADKGGDCDDSKPAVHPEAGETCGNGVDDDCASGVDNGCVVVPCTLQTVADFTTGKNATAGFSKGNGWVAGSSGFWGALWAIVYSNDPSNGYKSGGSTFGGSLTLPAATQYVELTVSAFNNVTDCSDSSCYPSAADTTIGLTFDIVGWNAPVLLKYGSSQYGTGAKYAKINAPVGFAGGNVTANVTISNAKTSYSYWGGIAVSKIKACY